MFHLFLLLFHHLLPHFTFSHAAVHPCIHTFIHPSMQSFTSYIQTCNHITDQPWFHLTPGFMLLSGSHIKSTLCVRACVRVCMHKTGLVKLMISQCRQAATSRTSAICVSVCLCVRACVCACTTLVFLHSRLLDARRQPHQEPALCGRDEHADALCPGM